MSNSTPQSSEMSEANPETTPTSSSAPLEEPSQSSSSTTNNIQPPTQTSDQEQSSSSSSTSPPPSTQKKCNSCSTPQSELKPLKPCSKCQTVFYCDRECQKKHFKVHKKVCAAAAQEYAMGANLKMESSRRTGKDSRRGGLQKWQFDT